MIGWFGSYCVVASANWPKVQDGTRIVRYEPHWLIFWLARWVPINPYLEVRRPNFRDRDPLIDERKGVIYCSLAQARELHTRAGAK